MAELRTKLDTSMWLRQSNLLTKPKGRLKRIIVLVAYGAHIVFICVQNGCHALPIDITELAMEINRIIQRLCEESDIECRTLL